MQKTGGKESSPDKRRRESFGSFMKSAKPKAKKHTHTPAALERRLNTKNPSASRRDFYYSTVIGVFCVNTEVSEKYSVTIRYSPRGRVP